MDQVKKYALIAAGSLLLLVFAGLGVHSCGSTIKEKICKTDSGSSGSGSWWDVKPSPK